MCWRLRAPRRPDGESPGHSASAYELGLDVAPGPGSGS